MSNNAIQLQCIAEGSKLRVRILTEGYLRNANCQFPKAIRVAGRTYTVPTSAVKLVAGPRGKYFYRINKGSITINDSVSTPNPAINVNRIYEDPEEPLCCICMTEPKSLVFAPCGHYCACAICTAGLRRICPMCRETIIATVERQMVE